MANYLLILNPLLMPIAVIVPTIAAIALVWSIYQTWADDPQRVTVLGTLTSVIGLGLLALLASRASAIVQYAVRLQQAAPFGTIAAPTRVLEDVLTYLTQGAATVAAFVLVWRSMSEIMQHRPGSPVLLQVALSAYTAGVIGLIARNAARAIAFITTAGTSQGAAFDNQLPALIDLIQPSVLYAIGTLSTLLALVIVWRVVDAVLRPEPVAYGALVAQIALLLACGVIARSSVLMMTAAVQPAAANVALITVLTPMATSLTTLVTWLIRGAAAIGALVLVYDLIEHWWKRDRITLPFAVMRVVGTGIALLLATNATTFVTRTIQTLPTN